VRYPQGGGLTPERQAFRERIRLEAAERFAAGVSNAEVAKDLRVSVRSVQRWRRAWHNAGTEGLRSAGPVSRPKLSEPLFAVLEQELARGPVADGWPDQTWTLARIKTLIGRRFHKSMTLSAIARMLHRHGFSHQVPARRAVERDEETVAGWVKETWPQVEGPWRRSVMSAQHRPPLCPSSTKRRFTWGRGTQDGSDVSPMAVAFGPTVDVPDRDFGDGPSSWDSWGSQPR
jgi:transposase